MVHKTDSGHCFFVAIFRVSQMTITHIFSKTTTPIDPVFCHHTAYSRPVGLASHLFSRSLTSDGDRQALF